MNDKDFRKELEKLTNDFINKIKKYKDNDIELLNTVIEFSTDIMILGFKVLRKIQNERE